MWLWLLIACMLLLWFCDCGVLFVFACCLVVCLFITSCVWVLGVLVVVVACG